MNRLKSTKNLKRTDLALGVSVFIVTLLFVALGTRAAISEAAAVHGDLRRKQGCTAAMAVEASRLLQVTIFSTLHKNVKDLEFSTLLPNVATIAVEVDAAIEAADAAVHCRVGRRSLLFRSIASAAISFLSVCGSKRSPPA
jgi:hypothetical protein